MADIEYFFSTLSPFAYLAGNRLEEIAAKHGASIEYIPVDLMTLFTRTGGTAPKDRHLSRMEYRAMELKRQSDKAGLTLNLQPAHWPVNAAPSSYAIIAAQNAGGGDVGRLVHSFMRACWAEEKDISDDAVVRDLLEQSGFDPGLAFSGMLEGAETYVANLEKAVDRGVFGSPFYITQDSQRFWGQDRLDDLDHHLAEVMV